jgi:hypothetical protein
MTISAQPIDMINSPNVYKEMDSWHITDGNTKTLWLQLVTNDSLGKRRYIPSAGSSLHVIFDRRPDLQSQQRGKLQQTVRTIDKIATLSNDMYYVALTVADSVAILSGTVRFTLTEGGQTKTWVQNWLLTKELTEAGY